MPGPTDPLRDAEGRFVTLPQLIAFVAGWAVVNAAGLLLIDGVVALVGGTRFGQASGWLVMILPALVYFAEFKAWRDHRQRWLVATVAALVGVGLGIAVVALLAGLAPLASGAIGALVAMLAYAPIWFLGIRRLTGVWPVIPTTLPKGRSR
jgi:hypothetical protein